MNDMMTLPAKMLFAMLLFVLLALVFWLGHSSGDVRLGKEPDVKMKPKPAMVLEGDIEIRIDNYIMKCKKLTVH